MPSEYNPLLNKVLEHIDYFLIVLLISMKSTYFQLEREVSKVGKQFEDFQKCQRHRSLSSMAKNSFSAMATNISLMSSLHIRASMH